MAACGACGTDLPPGARFCPGCGAPVEPAGAERKLVTILFADLVGSTRLGEALDPERLREVLDEYFAAMREEIEHEGGTVEKFIGDAVMAVFGVPVAHEDDAARAVRAAHRMHARLADLNAWLASTYDVRLDMRVGVHTGDVLAVHPPDPAGGMVTGDAVNVAARLEQAAPVGATRVSGRTARATRGMGFEPVGTLEIRGRDEPLEVFEAIPDAAPGSPPSARPPIVGRAAQLDVLASAFERVVSEDVPTLVTIYGEPGVGKSRLVEELEARLAGSATPPTVVRGRCPPYGDGVVYWPLVEILKRRAGVTDTEAPDPARERVERAALATLAGRAKDPERVAEALAFSVGLARAGSRLASLQPAQVRSETTAAWSAYLSSLAASAPLVVVIEDIHWADPAMLDLLEELGAGVAGAVLFLCSARPELAARRPGWGSGPGAASLELDPLPPSDAERLLAHLLAAEGTAADGAVRDEIVRRTGGNPFFLEEVVRHLGERGSGPSGWAIPDTVQAVLAARIDMLGRDEKRVLQAAAVVGREFWPGPVARQLATDRASVEGSLRLLEERGLVRRLPASAIGGEPELSFKHVLTRDVAYESLPRRERARAHAAVAAWIEGSMGGRTREFAELLAHHFLEAFRAMRDDPRADDEESERLRRASFAFSLVASREAAGRAALRSATARAEDALSVALGPGERAGALGLLGRARFLDSEGDLAWDSLREAAELLLADPEAAPQQQARACVEALELVTRERGAMRARLSRREAEPFLAAALERVAGDDPELLARLKIVQAFWPASFVEPPDATEEEAARSRAEEAVAIAEGIGRPDLASAALDGIGTYCIERALYAEWEPVIRRRLALVDSLSDPIELGDIFASAAWQAYQVGRYEDAEGYAGRGVEIALETAPLMALYCLDFRAVARCRLGRWDACLADVDLAAGLMGDRRDRPPGYASDHVGAAAFVHEARGRPEAADELMRVIDWLDGAEERPSPGLAVWAAEVLARRGSFDEARARLDRPDIASQVHAAGHVLEARCDLVAARGAWDEAAAVLDECARRADASGLLALVCHADRLRGVAEFAGGEADAAVAALAAAAAGFDDLGAAWEAARTRLHLAEALLAVGRGPDARRELAGARPVLEGLGSAREAAAAEELAARAG